MRLLRGVSGRTRHRQRVQAGSAMVLLSDAPSTSPELRPPSRARRPIDLVHRHHRRDLTVQPRPVHPVTGEAAISAWDPMWAPLAPTLHPIGGLLYAPRTPPSPKSPLIPSHLQSPHHQPLAAPRPLLVQPRQGYRLRSPDDLPPSLRITPRVKVRRFKPKTCEDRPMTAPVFSRITLPVKRASHLRPIFYLGDMPLGPYSTT